MEENLSKYSKFGDKNGLSIGPVSLEAREKKTSLRILFFYRKILKIYM